MSLTKLPLGRNNSVMTSLFPPRPRESLVVTSRLGTGNSRTFFLRCNLVTVSQSKLSLQLISFRSTIHSFPYSSSPSCVLIKLSFQLISGQLPPITAYFTSGFLPACTNSSSPFFPAEPITSLKRALYAQAALSTRIFNIHEVAFGHSLYLHSETITAGFAICIHLNPSMQILNTVKPRREERGAGMGGLVSC